MIIDLFLVLPEIDKCQYLVKMKNFVNNITVSLIDLNQPFYIPFLLVLIFEYRVSE